MKAQLSGEVRVNFRSETLSPDKMVDAMQMGVLEGLAGRSSGPPPAGPTPTPTVTPGASR